MARNIHGCCVGQSMGRTHRSRLRPEQRRTILRHDFEKQSGMACGSTPWSACQLGGSLRARLSSIGQSVGTGPSRQRGRSARGRVPERHSLEPSFWRPEARQLRLLRIRVSTSTRCSARKRERSDRTLARRSTHGFVVGAFRYPPLTLLPFRPSRMVSG